LRTVLIADDNQINRLLPKLLLEKEDFKIYEASTSDEVFKILGASRIDYLLLDISLPKVSGIDICKRIKGEKSKYDTKVIAYTAHTIDWEIKKFREAGFDDILIKPITKESLLQAIKISVK
jgi:putative two-component system response regulator